MEASQQTRKASGIVTRVGGSNDTIGAEKPRTFTQTAGPSTVMTTERTRPAQPPAITPMVVSFGQYRESKRIGKFADAAIAKDNPSI